MTKPIFNFSLFAETENSLEKAECFAKATGFPLVDSRVLPTKVELQYYLCFSDSGIYILAGARQNSPRVQVEFAHGAAAHRRKFGGGKGQNIAKAIGLSSAFYPAVVDATAGLGKDAFVLATLGCSVYMIERSPVAHILLEDGLARARVVAADGDVGLSQILDRIALASVADSQQVLATIDKAKAEVVYLDPMFPEKAKSAKAKKDMQAFHQIIGRDEDADMLFDQAMSIAKYRVVVKRPKGAGFLGGAKPSFQLLGKSGRFDIYTKKKMPTSS